MSREAWFLVALGAVVAAATLVGAVLLAIRVVRTRRMLGALGAGGKVAFYGALIYTILPVDLLPDPIYLDDMGVLAGALFYLGRLAAKHRAAQRVSRDAPAPTLPAAPPGGVPRR
ncbi:YkvA family protein [Micromonospora sp. WMMD1128]|uniref:YkvA family protein n=1 Tax=Micromonospora sp. WMMD1128 TaxID=3015150 RepID=UPI00248D1033|nr:YkvA family protein [Micromonospora sp. WMMD1128]WBB73127.1 YkvA family protein [Micromonospora sp. WMMD1128]